MHLIENEELVHCLTCEEKLNAWDYGEWVEEADNCTFDYRGYKCSIIRLVLIHENGYLEMGQLNGYLRLSPEHPWFGKDYGDIECDVHGGLTFAEGDENYYLIGFDTAHSGDIVPGLVEIMKKARDRFPVPSHIFRFAESYKNMQFVKNQLTNLVDQAVEAKEKSHNPVE